MSDKPISDLRRRMIADMTVRTFSDKTQHDYIRQVEAFARFLGRSPDTATGDDIRRFQLAQVEQGAQPPKMNTQASALRFFFTITLGRADLAHQLARTHYPRKLPRVLALEGSFAGEQLLVDDRQAKLVGETADLVGEPVISHHGRNRGK